MSLVYQIDNHIHYLDEVVRRVARRERPFNIQPAFEALAGFSHYHECFSER